MLGGGYDRSRLKPLNPDGNTQSEPGIRVVGTHRGVHAGLNICNPRPGFHYSWAARTRDSIQRARMNGAIPVREGDEEYAAYREFIGMGDIPHMQHTDLDSLNAGFGDLVLMRTPEVKIREIREERQRIHQARFRACGVEHGFIQEGHSNPGEDQLAQSSGRPLRFMRADHSSRVTAGPSPDGETVDPRWANASGIARDNG